MNNTLKYKGYIAGIEFSADDACFVGHIAGIEDIIGFHGESVKEIQQAFHDAVDDYIAACAAINKQPQKTASGKIMLRIAPELHAAVASAAKATGKSMNAWISDRIQQAIHS